MAFMYVCEVRNFGSKEGAGVIKCSPHTYEDLHSIFRTYIKGKKKEGREGGRNGEGEERKYRKGQMCVISVLGSQRQMDSWGLLAG